VTALRFPDPTADPAKIRAGILQQLDPASVGLSFQPVRARP